MEITAVQKFWNTTPCNTTRSAREIGSREFFADIEEKRYLLETHIPEFAEFGNWQGKKVMEVGCGLGTDFVQFGRAGAILTGVDYSNESLALAKLRVEQEGGMATFYHANAEELSKTVPLQIFDLIYSFGVLHHTPNPARAYKELTKYMDKNSRLKLMVYHTRSLKVLGVILRHGPRHWREKVAYYSESKEGSPITFTYTKKEITKLLESCGFEVISVNSRYIWMRWYWKWLPSPLLRWIDGTFGWNLCIEAKKATA